MMHKTKNFVTIRDSYKPYSKESNNPVDIKEYTNITSEFNKYLMDKVLDGHTVNFPLRLGSISVQGYNQKVKVEDGVIRGIPVDWFKTNQLWDKDPKAKEEKRLVFNFNSHTNGKKYLYKWDKSLCLVKNKSYYKLVLTRANKRGLASRIKDGKEYIIIN